eukprot:TRINITY_DN17213_c0_g1_i2.p2 TRINITY_DN17213_c0_g1~~TRINITY_DN17213_c0_g1_i2.p2  ORF type:complete len:139 (+),score=21.53 TRINITY_DN17213_c0_g1_i2:3-419(+)
MQFTLFLQFIFIFFLNETATSKIYTRSIVGSVRCVQETGLRQFKSCLYVISKRYKEEVAKILLGLLRGLSSNNAPMLSAFQRLRMKQILGLSEKIALETGFYFLFRNFLEKNDFIKICLLYTSPSPRDLSTSRMPSSA